MTMALWQALADHSDSASDSDEDNADFVLYSDDEEDDLPDPGEHCCCLGQGQGQRHRRILKHVDIDNCMIPLPRNMENPSHP